MSLPYLNICNYGINMALKHIIPSLFDLSNREMSNIALLRVKQYLIGRIVEYTCCILDCSV